MANPNIVTVSTIQANTAVMTVTTTAANIISNPSASNKVYKINALTIANGNTSSTSNVTVNYQKAGVNYALAGNVIVPTSATLVVLSKDSGIYLLEGDALQCNATVATGLTAVLSFEEIS